MGYWKEKGLKAEKERGEEAEKFENLKRGNSEKIGWHSSERRALPCVRPGLGGTCGLTQGEALQECLMI
jgi:hypothetical protein